MANHQWRKKCDEGCTCGKHQAHPCAPGCACSRHSADFKRKKCEPGCACGRHRKQQCDSGCTCSRHKPSSRRYTEEQREEARQRSLAKGREYMRQRRAADPEKARREAREQYRKNGRKHNLKWKFGITPEEFDAMLIGQGGRCYLCGEPMGGTIHIDHDRSCCSGNQSCGKCIRGLADQKCNQGIGQFGDDPYRLRRAADALEKAQKRMSAARSQPRDGNQPPP
jgi:hypothetical protein